MSRFVLPYADVSDSAGDPLSGAKLYFYASGTSTPASTFSDSALSLANANPVVADSGGRFGAIFLSDVNYKVVLKTSSDVTVWTADPVNGLGSGGGGETSLLLGDSFTGDGTTTAFTLSVAVTSGSRSLMVAVDGVTQLPATYSVSGTTLTFSQAPPLNSTIDVRAFSTAEFDEGLSTILVDTTLSVPGGYATVETALDYLATKWITPDATVTIQVAAGTHSHSAPIVISHPCSSRIQLKGVAAISHTLVSQQSVSGSAGAYSVVLTVSSVGTAAVGEYLYVYDTSGTGDHYAHRGIWKITAVDTGNNRLTLLNTNWNAAFPTNTVSSGTAYRLTTVLKFSNCDGLVVRGAVLGLLEDVAIVGNATDYWSSGNVSGTEKGTFGITVSGETVTLNGKTDHENQYVVAQGGLSFGQFVGVSDFDQQGIVCSSGGSIFGRYGASSSNRRRGWYAEACGQIQCKNSVGSGNYLDGYIADVGGAIICNLSTASGNGDNGISSVQGGSITATTAFATGNLGHGFHARGAFLNCGSSTSSTNGADGYHAEYAGVILASSCTASSNTNDGFEANHNGTVRALSATATSNGRYGVRASSGGNVDCTPLTASGNVTAAKSAQSLGLILDTTYETMDLQSGLTATGAISSDSNITATGYLRSNNGAENVQVATTSAGDLGFTMTGTARMVLKKAGVLHPSASGTQDLGRTTERWANVYATKYAFGASTQHISSGTGTPEGAVTAGVGSMFLRTDGGANTTLYIKESGAGNTGWVAK